MAKKGDTPNLPMNYKEELAKEKAGIKERIGAAGGGDFIRITQDKKFQMPDGTAGPGPLNVVILDFVSVNQFHDRPYKKGEESPPACFAIGEKPEQLVPSANSPVKQAESCKDCPNNEWGSNGKGKACSNLRVLAVREPGNNPDAKVMLIKVSPTAVKGFDAYVRTLQAQFDGLPIEFETEIYFDPNLSFGSLRFGSPKPNKNVAIHFPQKKEAKARLLAEPDVSQYKPLAPAKPAKGARR